ncbi:putative inorganic phosphate cotransporter [Eriocheir sinensis]|uniref:putative inorganic phosphate cotransporter n=1 Tax=Eriocheir sinensis TaxID=95602 RepID=UPI0021C8F930|nr:putative inorganic phosphate cotransporter [Eriocheir sinensis]
MEKSVSDKCGYLPLPQDGCVQKCAATPTTELRLDTARMGWIPWWRARDTFVLLSFLGVVQLYMVRVSLSIAIVAMVTRNETTNASQVSDTCPVPDDSPDHSVVTPSKAGWAQRLSSHTIRVQTRFRAGSNPGQRHRSHVRHGRSASSRTSCTAAITPRPQVYDTAAHFQAGEFEWSDRTIALVLGAFYYGSSATSFLGGRAAEKFGGRLIFGLGVVVPSVLSLLSPLCARASEYGFVALRVLEGMAQVECSLLWVTFLNIGISMPSIHVLIAAWIPPKDKAKHASIILSADVWFRAGIQIGTVIAMSFGGWLCDTTFLDGWPSVFYVFGGLGTLWGIPWFLLVHNLPEHHPRISPSELEYIQAHRRYVKRDKAVAIPWRAIATSRPFWAIVASSLCYSYSFYTLLTELPTFFNVILHFDMSKNALGSTLAYILQGTVCLGWGAFADWLHRRNYMTVNGIRKLSTSAGMYLSAACLVAMVWVHCDHVAAMAAMCLAVGFMGTMSSGSSLSEQDIAPNLAGSLKGLTTTLSSTTGFLTPIVTAAVTSGNVRLSGFLGGLQSY